MPWIWARTICKSVFENPNRPPSRDGGGAVFPVFDKRFLTGAALKRLSHTLYDRYANGVYDLDVTVRRQGRDPRIQTVVCLLACAMAISIR